MIEPSAYAKPIHLRECRHCRWWIYKAIKVAGVLSDYASCPKIVGSFPNAGSTCHYWSREPGSDDE